MNPAMNMLEKLFSPRTAEQIAADELRYRQMTYRMYNLLLRFHTVEPFNLTIPLPCPFPWDEFLKLNPSVILHVRAFEEETHYELSERQCSLAVMALVHFPNGPAIEVKE